MMISENDVFRKIKEISTRKMNPRPLVDTAELASELATNLTGIMPSLTQLKQLRLITFNDTHAGAIRLSLLGSVVNRDK